MYLYVCVCIYTLSDAPPIKIAGLAGKHTDMKRAPHVNLHVTPHFYSNTVLNITLSSGLGVYRACVSTQTDK